MRGSHPVTIAAVAVVAYAFCDLVHEVLGHGAAALASPTVEAVSLSTVALVTQGTSRMVSASGTLANLVAGLLAFALRPGGRGSHGLRYFLWLFASLNLFDATAYLLYSGILDSGDWAAVTAGFEPRLGWRAGMILGGAASYALSVRLSGLTLRRMVQESLLRNPDVPRLALLPYWVGGLLLVLGAVPNPVSPSLILTSGAAAGFGAMAGLLAVPRIAAVETLPETGAPVLGFSWSWTLAAILVGGVFVFVIGPGVAL